MKKLLIFSTLCLLMACNQKEEPKDYAVIHGKITNQLEETPFRLYDPIASESVILQVDEEGNFRDTLKLTNPVYFTAVYGSIFNLYLENDMDLEVTFDAEDMGGTISYSGKGTSENDFLKYKTKATSDLMGEDYKEYLSLETSAFHEKNDAYAKDLIDRMESGETIFNSNFITTQKQQIEQFKEGINAQHEEQLAINAELSPGMASPEFHDYIDYKGGTKSLSDFKGKYVYIDVWATWCVPCIYEMPFMAEVEEAYKGRNIHFLGLSIDRDQDEDKWRKMVANKELGGTQLLADNQIDSDFIRSYYIQGIPRFILLDPEGNIVNNDAPRPSEERLRDLFDSLDI